MDFRDLKSFNLALLGKHVWRIIYYLDSLLSRVFKAKYFSNSNILETSPKGNASFTWKSISAASPLVRKGVRWRVGNGMNIDVWRDPWIHRDGLYCPITPNFSQNADLKVADLI